MKVTKNLTSFILNTLFFTIIVVIAISIATISLTKKVNEYRNTHKSDIKITVSKQIIPIVSFTRGFVKKIPLKEGEEIKKDTVIAIMDNPTLKSKIDALQSYPDNVSAQTEAKVAQEELKNLTITSPVDGVVGEIFTSDGAPVDNLTRIMNIYSNQELKLLAELKLDQYQAIQNLNQLKAYSPRLNQTFAIKPELLRPEAIKSSNQQEKKIGVYFSLINAEDAASLLHNEDLELQIEEQSTENKRPIDFFVDFWNGLLARPQDETDK